MASSDALPANPEDGTVSVIKMDALVRHLSFVESSLGGFDLIPVATLCLGPLHF
jgi:hypothetical protein